MTGKTGRSVLAAATIVAIGVPSIAIATGEGRHLRLGERNPTLNARHALGSETEIISDNATYSTRQSNKRIGDGGGAMYGCRSDPGNEPCVRANNLRTGRAFEFASGGKEGGRIELADPSGAPLTTNASGVAAGFNADKVDGRDADSFAASGDLLWAAVSAKDAKLTGKRGAVDVRVANAEGGTYAITFSRAVADCSFTVSPSGIPLRRDVAFAAAPGEDRNVVMVDEAPADGADAAPSDFHLQVIC